MSTEGTAVNPGRPVGGVPRRRSETPESEAGCSEQVSLNSHQNGGRGPARRTTVGQSGNGNLGIRQMKEAKIKMGSGPETPDQRGKTGTKFAHIDVLTPPQSCETLHVSPTLPLGRKGLAEKKKGAQWEQPNEDHDHDATAVR